MEPLEWLTDNGSAYRAHETRALTRLLRLEPCSTVVRSPESFVKTLLTSWCVNQRGAGHTFRDLHSYWLDILHTLYV